MSSFYLFSLLLLFTPCTLAGTTIEQISEITNDYNKSFRPNTPNSEFTIELIIAASSDMTLNHANAYWYCLGSTKVEIEGTGNEVKLAVADSLVEVRDKLAKQMPNKVWAWVTKKRAEGDGIVKLPQQTMKITLSPYQEKYITVSSKHPIRIKAKRTALNMNSVLLLCAGIWLFCMSPSIAKQAAFYYLSGVSVSCIFGALIMLYFLMNRLIPKRDSVLVVGLLGSVGVWVEWFFNGFLRQTVFGLLKQNWMYVALYFAVFGGGGFVYCYIKGPPTENPRAHNVLQVLLQCVASACIVYSFNLTEIGLGMLCFIVISYIFYPSAGLEVTVNDVLDDANCNLLKSPVIAKLRKSPEKKADSDKIVPLKPNQEFTPVAQHIFPKERKKRRSIMEYIRNKSPESSTPKPVRRLLSDDEYLQQGVSTTQLELEKLRQHLNESKDGSPWRYINKLNDPKRFADFAVGSPHVSQTELSAFEEELDSMISESDLKSKYTFGESGSENEPESEVEEEKENSAELAKKTSTEGKKKDKITESVNASQPTKLTKLR